MSWAVGRTWLTGGRRSANERPECVGHPVGEIRAAPGDQIEAQRRLGALDVGGHPLADRFDVDALDGRIDCGCAASIRCSWGRVRRRRSEPFHDATWRNQPAGVGGSSRYRRRDDRRDRRHLRGGDPPALDGDPGGGRPLGTLVRAVSDPRSDPRAGRRRDGWSGRPGQGQRRREPRGSRRASGSSRSPRCSRIRDGKVVDQFIGALPEDAVEAFVGRLAPSDVDRLVADGVAAGDEECSARRWSSSPTTPARSPPWRRC